MRMLLAAAVVLAVAAPAFGGGDLPAAEVEPRVAHHVRRASELADRFDVLLSGDCPRFATPREWDAYVEREIEGVVLMVAHAEEAWAEATTTGDDNVRRAAKAPGRRLKAALPLADKLRECAENNGSRLDGGWLWKRVEREVPRRRAEIALPPVGSSAADSSGASPTPGNPGASPAPGSAGASPPSGETGGSPPSGDTGASPQPGSPPPR